VASRDLLLSALIAAGVAAGVTYLLMRGSPNVETVDVPPLVGLRPEQARTLAESRGLLLVLNEEKEDPRVQPGQIAEQRPLEGSRIHKGESITAALAKAPAAVRVPDLSNQTLAEARAALESAKLALGRITEESHSTVVQGRVAGQSAPAGTEAHAGAAVDLVMSKGPETAVVPNVVGRGQSRARQALTEAGFVPGTLRYRSDEDRSDGVVLEQTPAGGLPAPKGSKVDLVVNQVD